MIQEALEYLHDISAEAAEVACKVEITNIPAVVDVTPVEDVSENVTLVATSPAEMKVAQNSLATWFEAKIGICERDQADLAESVAIAKKAGLNVPALERQVKVQGDRIDFYSKCKTALEMGFCIVPNFPVELFAIRTNRQLPTRNESNWNVREQETESPLMGDGEYKDPAAIVDTRTVPDGTLSDGKPKRKTLWFAHYFREEIEFPVAIARPQIMSEVTRAMAANIFDEIGISPSRGTKKQDPIVLGIVRQKRRGSNRIQRVSFLLSWWVDLRDL